MADPKMHADELDIDTDLVRQLLRQQFPHWAELEIERVPDAGTDNALYRLGADMVVRLPRREHNVIGLEKERVWLPRLAPLLPLAVPVPPAHLQDAGLGAGVSRQPPDRRAIQLGSMLWLWWKTFSGS